ncbi:NADH:ubiquinone reductase (Na(+)-transporting) subunit C [Bacteroides sp. 224]|uniref:NADH:ubiquinone reductase (Na(+)-transporting) subunit C n=1 Tax=Bacteroides sp. 224 TaxID=2302936 RepID=UPI0013D318A1|nr:NADH:ubiquinone reductase (Na(+)-transporting) subunit C [Bacteroides sp. 224]NDV65175.1 NADH:ubiquinone reductase (Na(+)-transporting) subunit C [Bacteroides sp. 224]
MNTNSNSYTIIYASVMVVIVAFVLAFTSYSLKDIQNKNVELDKMKQILSSLNVDTKGQDAEALYKQYIKKDMIINFKGEVIAEEGGFSVVEKVELSKEPEDRKLAVYLCEVEGSTKYIIPLYGQGLWGPIWGYVALDGDKNTVYGTYFSHAGETPGLGAEIATEGFQAPFIGKHIMKDNNLVSIAVVKPGKTAAGQDYVNGISGGTITSVAVEDMLKKCLAQYNQFLTNK